MSENTDRKVWEHDWAIKSLQEGQIRTEADVLDIARDVRDVKDKNETDRLAFATLKASLEAAAKATHEAADKAITTRQFWLGVAAVCVTIAASLIGIRS